MGTGARGRLAGRDRRPPSGETRASRSKARGSAADDENLNPGAARPVEHGSNGLDARGAFLAYDRRKLRREMLKPTVTLCAVGGTRRREDGTELKRIGANYVLTAPSEVRISRPNATDPENAAVGPTT